MVAGETEDGLIECLPTDCGVDFAELIEVGVLLLVDTLGGVDFIDDVCFAASKTFSHGKAGRGSICNLVAVVAGVGSAEMDVLHGVLRGFDLVTPGWIGFLAALDACS